MSSWVLGNVFIIICCQVARTLNQNDDSGEGDEWRQLTETYTFKKTEYIVFTQRVTWDEAKVICPAFEGQLAMPNSLPRALFIGKKLASSDLVLLDAVWLGARKHFGQNWTWVNGEEISEKGDSNWPLWKHSQSRKGKDCMALTLRQHKEPVFADSYCGLPRPFICERTVAKETTGYPVPASWVSHKGVQYVLYQALINWYQAVAYCRSQGHRIAKFREPTFGNVLKGAMMKSRPALEMVWIGGHKLDQNWGWITDGTEFPAVRNKTTNYPPWMVGSEATEGDCLIFDQNEGQEGAFVALSCMRKRSFACEEYDSSTEGITGQSTTFSCDKQTCILVNYKLDWFQARQYCLTHYKKDLVQLTNMAQALRVVDAMNDQISEIRHVWIGGRRLVGDAWKWLDNSTIPSRPDTLGSGVENAFPPWSDVDRRRSTEGDDLCLNLDNAEYREPSIYGVACNETQVFVCVK